MINIVEKEPIKASGLTSLHISFTFNTDVINVIKSCDKYFYDSKSHLWELPCTSLAYLLDNLVYLDDITLSLKANNVKQEYIHTVLEHKYPPFKHQQEGIEFGLNVPGGSWLLLDEPGMGKTLQMIYLAEELKAQKGIEHCFIICGINTLKANWKREIEKYSTLSCRVLGEKVTKKGTIRYASVKERAEELQNPIDAFFVITNIETLRSADVIKAIQKSKNKFDMIVLDEAHKCLAEDSLINTSKGLLKIRDICPGDLVLSYDFQRNIIEYRPVIHVFNNGQSSKMLELVIEESGILKKLICTPEHLIYTENRGFVEAQQLNAEDIIVTTEALLNDPSIK